MSEVDNSELKEEEIPENLKYEEIPEYRDEKEDTIKYEEPLIKPTKRAESRPFSIILERKKGSESYYFCYTVFSHKIIEISMETLRTNLQSGKESIIILFCLPNRIEFLIRYLSTLIFKPLTSFYSYIGKSRKTFKSLLNLYRLDQFAENHMFAFFSKSYTFKLINGWSFYDCISYSTDMKFKESLTQIHRLINYNRNMLYSLYNFDIFDYNSLFGINKVLSENCKAYNNEYIHKRDESMFYINKYLSLHPEKVSTIALIDTDGYIT